MTSPEKKKVRVKVTFEVDYEVPADWDDDMTLFHLNESCFCTNNLLDIKLQDEECTCFPYDCELVELRERRSSPH